MLCTTTTTKSRLFANYARKLCSISLRRVVITACHSSPFVDTASDRSVCKLGSAVYAVRDVTTPGPFVRALQPIERRPHEQRSHFTSMSCDVPFDASSGRLVSWDLSDAHGNVKVQLC
jgi:hypothetical protein